MKRTGFIVALIVLMIPQGLMGLTKCYEVVPYKNFLGETDTIPPNNKISQTFVMTVDSLTMVSLWVGDICNV